MQKFLPIFPLSLVAYPGEKINLHIFEPRYKQLINECSEHKKHFGIPVVNKNEILEYGTEMRLVEIVKTYPDGEMDICTEGMQVFRVLDVIKEVPDKLYSGAVISVVENISDHHTRTETQLKVLGTELFDLLEIRERVMQDNFDFKSFRVAHFVGLDLMGEFELLRHPRETTRQKIILEHIRKILPVVKQMAEVREKAKLNGQFRMIHPPEGF